MTLTEYNAGIWLSLLRLGNQLGMISLERVLTEDEAMAYYAICRFAKAKANADSDTLERLSEDEGSSEIEGGGP